jgi:hypothetical protein
MRNLHDAYFPSGHKDPKVGISANTVDFCCRNSPVDSPLQNLYLKLAVRWWRRRSVVGCSNANRSEGAQYGTIVLLFGTTFSTG